MTEGPLQIKIIAADNRLPNRLLSILREQNVQVNASGLARLEDFSEEIKKKSWDLLLFMECVRFPIPELLEKYQAADIDIPLLVASTDNSTLSVSSCLKKGVSELIPQNQTERLIQAIKHYSRFGREIKQRRQLQRQLGNLEKIQQILLQKSTLPVALIRNGVHLYCNRHYTALFAEQVEQSLIGTSIVLLVATEDRGRLKGYLAKKSISNCSKADSISVLANARCEISQLELFATPAVFQAQQCLQVSVKSAPGNSDYAGQKSIQARLDLLTQLDNQPLLFSRIESAIEAAINKNITSILLLVSIDRFQIMQEHIGKPATNTVLQDVAEFLNAAINKPYTASRLTENEFGLLLYDSSLEEGRNLASYISGKVNNSHPKDSVRNRNITISTSIGIAVINAHALDAEDMIHRASINCAKSFPTAEASSLNRKSQKSILLALEKNNFHLQFQPAIAFANDGTERYEVLVRMIDQDGQKLPPADFLAQANLCNLAEAIDRQVLTQVFALPELQKNKSLHLHIHISANTLVNPTMLTWLSKALRLKKLPAQKLFFQISEIDLHSNQGKVLSFCTALEELGISKIITCFGSAMEPLAVLKEIKPAIVRLDPTLYKDILYSKQQLNDVRKLISAIHHQQIQVAVTGIEDLELLPELCTLGVDLVQDYCLQAPTERLKYNFPKEEKIMLCAS